MTPEKKEAYDCIVLPRQTKENYKHNDRTYDMTSIYRDLDRSGSHYRIVETDTIEDLADQIQQLRSSSHVIITDGSPFLVNNMFCVNSTIQIIGGITNNQMKTYVKMKYITDLICKVNTNTITYL